MRQLARWDPDHYDRIALWPLREALESYEQLLRDAAREEYHRDLLHYAIVSPYLKKGGKNSDAPKLPAILRD